MPLQIIPVIERILDPSDVDPGLRRQIILIQIRELERLFQNITQLVFEWRILDHKLKVYAPASTNAKSIIPNPVSRAHRECQILDVPRGGPSFLGQPTAVQLQPYPVITVRTHPIILSPARRIFPLGAGLCSSHNANQPWNPPMQKSSKSSREPAPCSGVILFCDRASTAAIFFNAPRSGRISREITRLAEMLVGKLGAVSFDTVLAPAMGGLVMGQEVARQTGSRYIFAEKVDDRLVLRRGFKLRPGEKILVVEDVVTRGGRVKECVDLIAGAAAECVGIAMLVDRSGGQMTIDVPVTSLLELTFPTYPRINCPSDLAAIPVEKPGS